jgi:daunorubicin resistance ABC transporter ATP-binding subunit
MVQPAIRIDGLRKSFGRTLALDGISLEVQAGTIYGLLGPNGAGKTTAVRILATLIRPDAGTVEIAGHDVQKEGPAVRKLIGLTGQYAALDEALSGRENLELIGRLHGSSANEARQRAGELMAVVGLTDAAGRPVRTYSGGMRRRADLAASLVGRPSVIFLDEPTTGLDPRSRVDLWALIGTLVHEGMTVLLTTQYLEEVDRLASRIAVLDHGRVIAEGTTADLKRDVGGDVVEVRAPSGTAAAAASVLSPMSRTAPEVNGETITVPVSDGRASLLEAVHRLDAAGIGVDEIALRRPTLDEVFLKLTGQLADDDRPAQEVA